MTSVHFNLLIWVGLVGAEDLLFDLNMQIKL